MKQHVEEVSFTSFSQTCVNEITTELLVCLRTVQKSTAETTHEEVPLDKSKPNRLSCPNPPFAKRCHIEMQALIPPRSPSPCSLSPLADGVEDMVSLPGSQDDNETTRIPSSDSLTLATLGDEGHEECAHGGGTKHQMSEIRQRRDLQNRRGPTEEPKAIWTKSRMRALRYFLMIHFVPVATTLTLFWLYLKGFQWRANDIQLKTLLFAAKLHESWIVVSLGDILFHRIRYHLLTGRGVSFGLLVSPFRVSNPCALFQAPFLSSARFTFKSGPELLTVLLVVLVSVLALLAAPSSGVLMIPRYDWWQVPNDEGAMAEFKKQDLDDAIYIGAPFDELFPLHIDGRFVPNSAWDSRLETTSFSDRFEHILSGLDQILVDGSSGANDNVTVVDGATVDSFALAYQEQTLDECEVMTCLNISRVLNTTETAVKGEGLPCLDIICQSIAAQASTPLAMVTQKLFDRYRTWMSASSNMFMITAHPLDAKKGDLTWRQPSVSMQCSSIVHDSPSTLRPIIFQQFGSFSPFSISADGPLQGLITKMENQSNSSTTYIDISHLLPAGVTASTALLMSGGYSANNPATYLCLVDARWIESHIWFTAPYATIMQSGVSMETLRAATGSDRPIAATSPVINITSEYANSLDADLTVSSIYKNNPDSAALTSPFDFIQRYCHRNVEYLLGPKCSMLAHTLYLTDSLRRTQALFRYHSATEIRESETLTLDPDKWTKLDYRLYHQLHAYKFEGLIIKLSMSVLLIHMMLVYSHLLLLVLGDGWCSSAWSELGELLALAILTRPSPLLQNAGGGIDDWKTWNLRAFVREVTPEGRLELVLKETVGSPRVLLDKGQEKTLVEPEADRRYG